MTVRYLNQIRVVWFSVRLSFIRPMEPELVDQPPKGRRLDASLRIFAKRIDRRSHQRTIAEAPFYL